MYYSMFQEQKYITLSEPEHNPIDIHIHLAILISNHWASLWAQLHMQE